MYPRKATDALGAALERWKQILFQDFRFGNLLKISAVTLLAEVSGGSFNGNYSNHNKGLDKMPSLPPMVHAGLLAALGVALVIGLVIGLVVFYLSCRMKFVEFHIAVTNDSRVGPAWGLYGSQTWRLFWVTIGLDFVALLALVAVVGRTVFTFIHQLNGNQPSLRQILELILTVLPAILLVVLALQVALMIVRDLMLPVWALEDAETSHAWQVAWDVVVRDPMAFVWYALLKVVIHIGASLASFFAFIVALLISAIPFAVVGFGIYVPFHAHSMPLVVMLFIVEGLVALLWLFALMCLCFGAPAFLYQCYAVEWFAGRYGPLGNVMYPQPITPLVPPPPPIVGGDWATSAGQ